MVELDLKLLERVVREHEGRIVLLSNKVKWLDKERLADKLLVRALQIKIDSLYSKVEDITSEGLK